jgi:hypothetical protein
MEACGGKDMRNTDRGGEGGGSEYPKRQNDGCRCFYYFLFLDAATAGYLTAYGESY